MQDPQNGHDEQTDRILENIDAARDEYGSIYLMNYDEFEALFEDRDPFEFL